MEYGRLVVLGYSSYRVMSVQTPARTAAPPRSQSSFGLGVASSNDDATESLSAAHTPPPRSGSSRSSSNGSSSNNGNGNYSLNKKALGQLWEPIGDQNAHYILQKRKRANGVTLRCFHHFRSTAASSKNAPLSSSSHARTKDIQAVTKRMMQIVDQQRERDASDNNNSDYASDGTASIATTNRAPPFLMCVPMNGSDAHASLTEYALDASSDMFQIGRLPCRQNDFVIPGPRVGASGTISRFAARIVCSRSAPFECRVFAGGFDNQRKMTTAGHALKFCASCATWFHKLPLDHSCVAPPRLGVSPSPMVTRRSNQSSHDSNTIGATGVSPLSDVEHVELALSDSSDVPIDGVTKNGVRVWLPEHRQWFEVSVNGNLYAIENRAVPSTSRRAAPMSAGISASVRHSTFNRPVAGSDGVPSILTDGAIIDLGGVQLQFQTNHRAHAASAPRASLSESERLTVTSVTDQLERLNVQCPVQLHALRFTRGNADADAAVDPLEVPHVFPACGHVFGFDERIAASQMCPLCRHPGFLVRLLLKENSQLQSAAEHSAIPECVLNPCGHAISIKLAAYYAKLLMPSGFAICPFCGASLHPTTPYSRLYLYSEEAESSR